jgi:MFS-type transporter involved in bile tolerance (Atg22 family)
LIQLFLFIGIAPLADYGSNRKKFLILSGWMSVCSGLCMVLVVTNSKWWLAFLAYISVCVTTGSAFVFHNSWVPILTRNEPSVANSAILGHTIHNKTSLEVSDYISSRSFSYGFLSATTVLIVTTILAFAIGDLSKFGFPSVFGLQIGVGLAATWAGIVMYFYTRKHLSTRAGPPYRGGYNIIAFSCKQCKIITNIVYHTFKHARKLKQLFIYLAAWFIYSDGMSSNIKTDN